jgi:Flp pilus assembly protein TadG
MKSKISDILKKVWLKDKNQVGATAVEFALILPMLVTILFGIFQFGFAFNNWIALTHAASEGARLASVGQYSEQEVKNRAPSVNILSVTATGVGGEIGDPVTVTVVGQVLDIQIPFVGNWPIQLQSTATMRLETSG